MKTMMLLIIFHICMNACKNSLIHKTKKTKSQPRFVRRLPQFIKVSLHGVEQSTVVVQEILIAMNLQLQNSSSAISLYITIIIIYIYNIIYIYIYIYIYI